MNDSVVLAIGVAFLREVSCCTVYLVRVMCLERINASTGRSLFLFFISAMYRIFSYSCVLFYSLPATSPSPSKASSPSVTALANGLTIVSEDASTTTTISLTFPKAGSGDEAVGESGAALINKELSFKSGSGLSAAVLLRHLEDEGAVPFSTAGRNGATVGFTAAPDKAIPLIPLLATECSFEKWEVRDAKKLAAIETAEANKNAQVVLTESVFAAAYGAQSAMGRPFFSADASTPAIQSFRERAYGLNGAVLSATGITDHAAFVAAVKDGLEDAPAGSASPAATATFVGGESRIAAPSMGFAHVALGFEGPTGPIATVIKHCLKLMGTSGFASPGLIGVYGSAPSAGAADILDSLSTAVTSKVSADTVQRAKGLAKAEALFALDGGSQALASAMAAVYWRLVHLVLRK